MGKVVIGDVDCTAAGKPLCEKFGVRGYPTIKYFNPPDDQGEDYKGGRDLAALKKFVESDLGPGCSVDAPEDCSAEQKAELDKYVAMPAEERAKMLADLKEEMSAADKKSTEDLEKLKEASAPKIKLLRAATPSAAP